MPVGPEIPQEIPQIVEHDSNAEFVVDESLKHTGIQPVQQTFKPQVTDDRGQSLITTPTTKVISVSPPADSITLTEMSKGDTDDSNTWRGKFWLRILQKALHFGWQILGRSPTSVPSN